MYKKILVPIDGSPISARALQEAIRLTKEQQARLRIIYVLDEIPCEWVANMYTGAAGLTGTWRLDGTKMLEQARRQAAEQTVEAEIRLLEKPGLRVADAIVSDANDGSANLIVMGTHGRKGLNHLLLGSVAEKVVRMANVPVILVPGQMAG